MPIFKLSTNNSIFFQIYCKPLLYSARHAHLAAFFARHLHTPLTACCMSHDTNHAILPSYHSPPCHALGCLGGGRAGACSSQRRALRTAGNATNRRYTSTHQTAKHNTMYYTFIKKIETSCIWVPTFRCKSNRGNHLYQ